MVKQIIMRPILAVACISRAFELRRFFYAVSFITCIPMWKWYCVCVGCYRSGLVL
jgi:hypothetical protein